MPSGKIRNYAGIKLQFGSMIGAKIEYSELSRPSNVKIGKVGAVISDSGDNLTMNSGVAGIGTNSSSYNDRMAQSFGAGVFSAESSINLGLRVLNGRRNWSYLIDTLK
jgi:hypothetical protein